MAEAWKEFETQSGELFRTKRFWANSGERADFEGDGVEGQCKLVKSLSLNALTKLAEEMHERCAAPNKIGVVCVKVRRGKGVKSEPLVVMTFAQFQKLRDGQTPITNAGS